MDRRNFLKKSIAALSLASLTFNIKECNAIWQTLPAQPIGKFKDSEKACLSLMSNNRMIYGGNLFNAYTHGRDSVDPAEVKVKRIRQFLWKGAY